MGPSWLTPAEFLPYAEDMRRRAPGTGGTGYVRCPRWEFGAWGQYGYERSFAGRGVQNRRRLCPQQSPFSGGAAGRHQGRPRHVGRALAVAATGRAFAAKAGRIGAQIRDAGLHRLSRGRQEAEDAEAVPEDEIPDEPGRISRQMGPAGRLSAGGAELRRAPLR